MKIDVRWRKRS